MEAGAKTITCGHCKSEGVSSEATKCPHCGGLLGSAAILHGLGALCYLAGGLWLLWVLWKYFAG